MDFLTSFLLGLLQGITEFLPISSSGHLVLGQSFLLGNREHSFLLFEVVVHMGTLCSIIVFYYDKIRHLFLGVMRSLYFVVKREELPEDERSSVSVLGYIILATIPAVFVGFFIKDIIEDVFYNPWIVSLMLICNGLVLLSTRWLPQDRKKKISLPISVIMGLAQALAIIPGISRSGMTITTGIAMKGNRMEIATFSFLMAIPVIFGGLLLVLIDAIGDGLTLIELWGLFVGFLSAFVSGYFSLRFLIKFIEKGKFYLFGIYCLVVGFVGIFFV